MAMHPDLIPNHILKTYPFEELCFFNDNHTYAKGVAFYNERFPDKRSASETAMYFEKSPPYFASPEAPMRASALVPSAKLIVMLREPMQRALSWYHVSWNDAHFHFLIILSRPVRAPKDIYGEREIYHPLCPHAVLLAKNVKHSNLRSRPS